VIPITVGAAVYRLWRGIDIFDIPPLIYSTPPDWIIFNLPDGLWLYALLSSIIFIWKDNHTSHFFLWLSTAILLTFLTEIMQAYRFLFGTFDWNDMLAYLIAGIVSIFPFRNKIQISFITIKFKKMKLRRHLFSTATLIVFALLFWSSASTKHITTALVVPDFDFSPPSPVAPGSAGVKIALLDPIYAGNFIYSSKSPFSHFRESMGKDFEEILTARGYILKGPYEAYDLMTYSDKNECELGLEVEINLNILQTSGGWKGYPPTTGAFGITSGNYSTYSGTLNLSGKITISIIETFTRQKLIVKSVPVPQENIIVKAEEKYDYGESGIPLEDPGVHNPIANSLSNLYKTTMKRGWDILAKEELVHVQTQVPEIREKSGFVKH